MCAVAWGCVIFAFVCLFFSARKAEMKIHEGFRYQTLGFLVCCNLKYFIVVEATHVAILL